MIIGSARSGTTALVEAIGRHPRVQTCLPTIKEPHFFSDPARLTPWAQRHRVGDWDRYQRLFDRDDALAWGEASPGYMDPVDAPEVARRIRDRLPDVRLIAILRRPLNRLWSSWLEFEGGDPSRPEEFIAYAREHMHDMSEGLRPYLELFPREQLLVLLHEDMVRAGQDWWKRVFEHLAVEPIDPHLERSNAGGRPRNKLLGQLLALGPEARNLWLRGGLPMPPDRVLAPIRSTLHRWRQRNLAPPAKLPADIARELEPGEMIEVLRLDHMLGGKPRVAAT